MCDFPVRREPSIQALMTGQTGQPRTRRRYSESRRLRPKYWEVLRNNRQFDCLSEFSRSNSTLSPNDHWDDGLRHPIPKAMIGLVPLLRSSHSTSRSRRLCLALRPSASIVKFPIPTRAMANLKGTSSPYEIERTSSPYPNPYEQSPRSKVLSQRTSNFHSTSIRNLHSNNIMVSQTVNKTSLHPGGVQ